MYSNVNKQTATPEQKQNACCCGSPEASDENTLSSAETPQIAEDKRPETVDAPRVASKGCGCGCG